MFGNMFRNVKALPLRRSRLGFHGKRGAGGSNADDGSDGVVCPKKGKPKT